MVQSEKAKVIKYLLNAGDKYKDCNVAEIFRALPNDIKNLEGLTEATLRNIIYSFEIPHSKNRKYSAKFEESMRKRFDDLILLLSAKFNSQSLDKELSKLLFDNEIDLSDFPE